MKLTAFIALLFIAGFSSAQSERTISFYNVENLFDTLDNPKKNDNEFLPGGKKKWDSTRYWTKIERINQVMDTLELPLIAGFCEVENITTVMHIVKHGNMRTTHAVVHHESPDMRGIDNALIYDKTFLKLKSSGTVHVAMPSPRSKTRDILWAKFVRGKDSIMAIVNHWPSRIGGQAETEPKRLAAALEAKEFVDSVIRASKKMKIVFMGDLNDYPDNRAPQKIEESLNPMISAESGEFGGSYSYRGEWGVLDHIYVSKNFKKKGVKLIKKSGKIHSNSFLLSEFKGNKTPFRTYAGSKYLGGYSDHFPVSIRVKVNLQGNIEEL